MGVYDILGSRPTITTAALVVSVVATPARTVDPTTARHPAIMAVAAVDHPESLSDSVVVVLLSADKRLIYSR